MVAWRHRSRGHSTQHRRFPIRSQWKSNPYLA